MPYGGVESDLAVFTTAGQETYWNGQSLISGTQVIVADEPSFGFSRASLVFTRTTPAGTREDVVTTHLDWSHLDIGVCAPLSSTEMGEVETAIDTFFTAQGAKIPTAFTLDRIRWAEYQPINPRPGPVVRDTDKNTAGGAALRGADQLALTSTYRTCSRRHWGRSYWPMHATQNIDTTYGRITNAVCDAVAGALDTLLSTEGAGGGITPVVASIQYQGVMNIRELVVDNVWDVVRRRRAKAASYRKVYTP